MSTNYEEPRVSERTERLYRMIAGTVDARLNCKRAGNDAWFTKHEEQLRYIERNLLPSGSGFDNGTEINLDKSTGEHLVLTTSFHHMDEHGCYDGWTEHEVHVTASLLFRIGTRITGRDRNGIKEYMHEVFNQTLNEQVVRRYDKETEVSTYEVKR